MSHWKPYDEPEREPDDDDWNYHYESDEEREIEFVDINTGDLKDTDDVWETNDRKSARGIGDFASRGNRENIEDVAREEPIKSKKRVIHSSLAPRFSLRQRRRQLIATVSFVALLLIILLGSYTPTRQTLVRTFSIPVTPTATLAPGVDRFYIGGEPPWGKLYVDGKLITRLPDPIRNEPPLRLARGRHTLTWIAAPFPPRTCTITVPPSYRVDSCDLNSFIQANTLNSAWLFSFPVSLLDLSGSVQRSLIQAVQETLDANAPSETVRPGEVYATNSAQHPLMVAKEPLIATLHYQLDVTGIPVGTCSSVFIIDNQECSYETQDCHFFCTATQLFSMETPASIEPVSQGWNVLGVVSYRWDYKTQKGIPVAVNQPDQLPGVTPQNHLVPLSVTWDGVRWHVVSDLSLLDSGIFSGDLAAQVEPACASAISNVTGDRSLDRVLPSYYSTHWTYTTSGQPAVGCLGIVTLEGGMTPTPQQTPAYCLHRFGVFVAANKVAHSYWPSMPVADAYEQQLAQQLAAQYDPMQQ